MVHAISLPPDRVVSLTVYEVAILRRIVAGEPVRTHTPYATEAMDRFRGLGLVEGDGERIAATEAGAMVCRQIDAMEIAPPVLEWMDDPWRDAMEWHLACEDLLLRNWDLWVKMEAEPGA
jgi:hypothetical protein